MSLKINKNNYGSWLVLSLLIANPFIFFLLSKSLIWAIIPTIFTVLVLFIVKFKFQKFNWLLPYVVNLLVIISLLIHFEVVFRYAFPEYIIEDLYSIKKGFYFNKPYLNKILSDKEFSILYRTNSQGYRISGTQNQEVALSDVDWLFIGDSYTQGAQVDFEDLYTTQLFKYFPDKIIVNAGVSGMGLPEEYQYFVEIGKELKPKKVFLQLCNFNDFMNVEDPQISFTDYLMHYSDLSRSILYGMKYKAPGQLPLGRWTEPFYPMEKDNINYNVFYKTSSEKKDKDLESVEYYLDKINNAAKEIGAELIVFLVPTKEQLYYHFFEEVALEFELDVQQIDFTIPNKLIKEITDKYDIGFLDLYDEYIKYIEEVFFDYDEHWNQYGHKLTSHILAQYLQDIRNSKVKMISKTFHGERYPTIFNDDGGILFQAFVDRNIELMVADSTFTTFTQLTFNDVDETHPTYSRSSDLIAFTEGNQNNPRTNVVLGNFDLSRRKTITHSEKQFGAIPSFSSDGSKLVFAEWWENKDTRMLTEPQIVLYDIDKDSISQITKNNYENWRPVFSHDNKEIYYISRRNENFDIYKYDLLNHREIQITFTSYDEWDPSLSQDGNMLVYAAYKDSNWDLFEMELNKNEITQLTSTLGNEWDPVYNKKNQIYFAGEYGFIDGIFVMNYK